MRRDESGTITIFALGICVAILFLGGLSLDLWRAFAERRALAAVVDAAAVAAASAIDVDHFRSSGAVVLDPGAAVTVACTYLATHADPPVGCDGVRADPTGVEVRASREVGMTLLRVLAPGEPPLTIEVTARASPRRSS